MQVLTREFFLYQLSWLSGPKNGSNGAINLYKYQFNPQKLGLSTSLTLTETLGNNLQQKQVSSIHARGQMDCTIITKIS